MECLTYLKKKIMPASSSFADFSVPITKTFAASSLKQISKIKVQNEELITLLIMTAISI